MGVSGSHADVEASLGAVEAAWRAVGLAEGAAVQIESIAVLMEGDSASWPADRRRRVAVARARSEHCRRAAEGMHVTFVRRLEAWLGRHEPGSVLRPRFLELVAAVVGWDGAVLTLSCGGGEKLVAASDRRSRRSHELEVLLSEGPSMEAMRGLTSAAQGAQLAQRWPHFGPAVARMGVRAVAAVPLLLDSDSLTGSLMVVDPAGPRPVPKGCGLDDIAGVLTRTLLRGSAKQGTDVGDLPALELFDVEDFQPSLHQAVGMLSVRYGWSVDDALTAVRAHAFAQERTVAEVAEEVVHGGSLEP